MKWGSPPRPPDFPGITFCAISFELFVFHLKFSEALVCFRTSGDNLLRSFFRGFCVSYVYTFYVYTNVYTFSEYFHITLGSLWGHFGDTLGVILKSLWGHFGCHLGVILKSLWVQSGIILASFWRLSGPRGCPPARNRELAILFYFDWRMGDCDWEENEKQNWASPPPAWIRQSR